MHEVYVATDRPCRYPEQVLVAGDPPALGMLSGRHANLSADCVEVMVAAHAADAGKGTAESGGRQTGGTKPEEPTFTTRPVPAWVQPIMSYLNDGSLPTEEVSARQIQRRAKAYTIINGELYKRSVTSVLR
ncbi:uncharacterized protein LOC104582245 [Brachypodium distachyon]|uniref:uncharacterized protein LOC104582245 n=1 Tax=Brachypodium distachyon TaxID=15368 RepID=UPI0005300493|nr:uncharacterized protein LOC104582245 [Brachypodium distachyon]|eukprot:XP_010229946.1 uncharacterized protein LOC104582245 [Brachypodium distachyon]